MHRLKAWVSKAVLWVRGRLLELLQAQLRQSRGSITRSWRQASFVEQLLVCIGGVVLIVSGFAILSALSALTTSYTAAQGPLAIVAATIAVLSLIVGAITATANFRRQRRDATLAAYNGWSDTTWQTRIDLRKRLGDGVLSDEFGAELAAGSAATTRHLVKRDREELAASIVMVLNGLERLAVGVNLGTYDIVVIRKIAGTLVVRYWN